MLEASSEFEFAVDRVTFAGDWHMRHVWAVEAIRHAADAGSQLILHTGDFGYWFTPEFVNAVEDALDEHGLNLWFADGNHDNHPMLRGLPRLPDGTRELSPHVIYLPRGTAFSLSGVRFLACGGAVSIDRHKRIVGSDSWPDEWWPEEEITDADVAACHEAGPVDVALTHDCPAGVPDRGKLRTLWPQDALDAAARHRERLRWALEQAAPRLVVHGHYHDYRRTTADVGWGPALFVGLHRDNSWLDGNLWTVDVAQLPGGDDWLPGMHA